MPHGFLWLPNFVCQLITFLYFLSLDDMNCVCIVSSSEKAMAPHSSTLAWKISRTEEPGRLQSMGSLRVGHDWATSLSLFTSCIGEGNGNPLQCSCLENPRDGRAWWAAIYGVTQSRTRLKWLSSSSSSLFLLLECKQPKDKNIYLIHCFTPACKKFLVYSWCSINICWTDKLIRNQLRKVWCFSFL